MRILLLMILMIPPPTLHSYISKAKGGEENTESTGLAEFFQEPKLGTSWYNPSGPEPTFDMAQANGTVYTSQLGADVFMSCKVKRSIHNRFDCLYAYWNNEDNWYLIGRSIQFYNFGLFCSTSKNIIIFCLRKSRAHFIKIPAFEEKLKLFEESRLVDGVFPGN